jgi:type IV pilus assembly protein PilE
MDGDASAGFTLIEMLAVVVIAAILAALALPAYTDYMRRARTAEATSGLAAMRVRLEQHYQDYRNYGSTAAGCGVATPSGQNFSFTCNWGAGANNQGYLITAIGISNRMSGFIYTVDHGGNRQTTGLPAGWGQPPYDCWVVSKGGGC